MQGHEFKRIKKALKSLTTSTNLYITDGWNIAVVEHRNSPYVSRHEIRYGVQSRYLQHIRDAGGYIYNDRVILGVIEHHERYKESITGRCRIDDDNRVKFLEGVLKEMQYASDNEKKIWDEADKWSVVYEEVPVSLLKPLLQQVEEYFPILDGHNWMLEIAVPIPVPVAWHGGKPIFKMKEAEAIRASYGEDAVRIVD